MFGMPSGDESDVETRRMSAMTVKTGVYVRCL